MTNYLVAGTISAGSAILVDQFIELCSYLGDVTGPYLAGDEAWSSFEETQSRDIVI